MSLSGLQLFELLNLESTPIDLSHKTHPMSITFGMAIISFQERCVTAFAIEANLLKVINERYGGALTTQIVT